MRVTDSFGDSAKKVFGSRMPVEQMFDDEPGVFYVANVPHNVNQLLESRYR
jgi:hypothetical protein